MEYSDFFSVISKTCSIKNLNDKMDISFQLLGLDSVRKYFIINELIKFGINIQYDVFTSELTPRDLYEIALAEYESGISNNTSVKVFSQYNDETINLTSAQIGIWSAIKLSEYPEVYYCVKKIKIDGFLDNVIFNESLSKVIKTCDYLNCLIKEVSGDYPFFVCNKNENNINHDFHFSNDTNKAHIFIKKSIDYLANDFSIPPYKSLLFSYNENEHEWIFIVNHLYLDGHGVYLFIKTVLDEYDNILNGKNTTLEIIQPLSILASEKKYFNSNKYIEDEEFWYSKVTNLISPSRMVNRDYSESLNVHKTNNKLEAVHINKMLEKFNQYNVSISDVLIILFSVFLSFYTKNRITLGVPLLGQIVNTDINAMPLSMTMNILPVSFEIDKNVSVKESVMEMLDSLFNYKKHSSFRHEKIKNIVNEKRLFTAVLNFIPFSNVINTDKLTCEIETINSGPVEDLSMTVYYDPEKDIDLCLEANYYMYNENKVNFYLEEFKLFFIYMCDCDFSNTNFDSIGRNFSYDMPKLLARLPISNVNNNMNLLIDENLFEDDSDASLLKTEKIIYDIIKEVLKLDVIDFDKNLLEFGISSLSAIFLLEEINKRFSIRITYNFLLEKGTIRNIAKNIDLFKGLDALRKKVFS
ncbi:condensation domain-containing protein [Photorhabdus sp. SF281]|uniref:condensation domain-containing protein n=1 Tax=Photorhabdus sp. SF281 TaxID=3459527 RepID=UPI0040445F98